jgi:hypothetical protein
VWAGTQEDTLGSAVCNFEPEYTFIERNRAVEVGYGQMNVADLDPGLQRPLIVGALVHTS